MFAVLLTVGAMLSAGCSGSQDFKVGKVPGQFSSRITIMNQSNTPAKILSVTVNDACTLVPVVHEKMEWVSESRMSEPHCDGRMGDRGPCVAGTVLLQMGETASVREFWEGVGCKTRLNPIEVKVKTDRGSFSYRFSE